MEIILVSFFSSKLGSKYCSYLKYTFDKWSCRITFGDPEEGEIKSKKTFLQSVLIAFQSLLKHVFNAPSVN